MRKVAIVGVEGSGKTVLLAGLGDLYSRPDEQGYFLSPKDFNTNKYVGGLVSRLRSGKWPAATAEDVFQRLEWTLKRSRGGMGRPDEICEISCLDFAGEVYRKAFIEPDGEVSTALNRQIESLWDYIKRADDLIVLINLSDVISHGVKGRRTEEALWVTNALLSAALKERPGRLSPRVVVVLSQADNYRETIRACGGAKATLEKYLPHFYYSFDWLEMFEVCSVDKTGLNDDGVVVPAKDFTFNGLKPIMDWILRGGTGGSRSADPPRPPKKKEVVEKSSSGGVEALDGLFGLLKKLGRFFVYLVASAIGGVIGLVVSVILDIMLEDLPPLVIIAIVVGGAVWAFRLVRRFFNR